MPETLYISTGNKSKFAELCYFAAQVFPGMDIKMSTVEGLEETGLTFVENARLKARALLAKLHNESRGQDAQSFWVLADDSGLCVDGLEGAPGLYSARYSGAGATDVSNTVKLLLALKSFSESDPHRNAKFVCALVLCRWDNEKAKKEEIKEFSAEGEMPGRILLSASGDKGFGYDPVFCPEGHDRSLAELSEGEKNKISHRYRAFAELKKALG